MIQIRDWMSKPVITIAKDKSVFDAAKKMDEKAIGCLTVMKGNDLQGILTERDIVRKVMAKGINPEEKQVGEIMTTSVKTVDIDANFLEVAKIMDEHKFRRVIITENAKVVGIITSGDLIKLVGGQNQKT